jgi:plastocyanin
MSDTETEDSGAVTRRGFLRGATAGATATVAAGTAVGQETGSEGNASGNASGNQTGGGGGGGTEQVVVGPGGDFVFEPEELTIAPGTAVEFTWESDGHNVAPEEGDWGHLPIEDTGFSFTTPPFEETGSFPYVCEPHASAGMKGTIEVAEGGGGDGEGGGSSGPSLPDSAKTLGIAATTALASTLGLAYFFMKYGGEYGMNTEET